MIKNLNVWARDLAVGDVLAEGGHRENGLPYMRRYRITAITKGTQTPTQAVFDDGGEAYFAEVEYLDNGECGKRVFLADALVIPNVIAGPKLAAAREGRAKIESTLSKSTFVWRGETHSYYAKTHSNLKSILYGDDHANKVWAALELLNLGHRATVTRALKAKNRQTANAARIAFKREGDAR